MTNVLHVVQVLEKGGAKDPNVIMASLLGGPPDPAALIRQLKRQ